MSLTVSPEIVEKAKSGQVDDRSFIECIKESLPAAWAIFSRLAAAGVEAGGPRVHAPQSMPDAERGQVLRAMASNAIRGAVERHFGFVLAFQNCHKVAAFAPADVDSPAYRAFTSIEAQLLNQTPEMRDC